MKEKGSEGSFTLLPECTLVDATRAPNPSARTASIVLYIVKRYKNYSQAQLIAVEKG